MLRVKNRACSYRSESNSVSFIRISVKKPESRFRTGEPFNIIALEFVDFHILNSHVTMTLRGLPFN